MLIKKIFEQKSSCDVFKSMLPVDNYECRVFGASKDIPWADFETITDDPTHTLSQKLPTLSFFSYSYLQLELDKKLFDIIIIMLTKCLESPTHTKRSLYLKYYYHTTTGSVDFYFQSTCYQSALHK